MNLIHWDWIVTIFVCLILREAFTTVVSLIMPVIYPTMRAYIKANAETAGPLAQAITEELYPQEDYTAQ